MPSQFNCTVANSKNLVAQSQQYTTNTTAHLTHTTKKRQISARIEVLFPFGIVTHVLNKHVKNRKQQEVLKRKGKKRGVKPTWPASSSTDERSSPRRVHFPSIRNKEAERKGSNSNGDSQVCERLAWGQNVRSRRTITTQRTV